MDRELTSDGGDHEVGDAEIEQQIQISDALEAHDAGETQADHAVPGVDGAALGAAVESHNAPDAPSNAVDAINAKVSRARTRMHDRHERGRLAHQKERIKGRSGGKDWTATELADVLAKQGAQGVIVQLGARKPEIGIQALKDAGQWDALLGALPKGKLDVSCRRAVDRLVEDSIFDLADMMRLFEIRFGHKAEDVSSGADNAKDWDGEVMRVTWRQLAALPAHDVTLNTAITTFRAIAGAGAFGPAWDDPTINTVDIGQDVVGDFENLEGTVRHEIGHGVHAQIQNQVNPWLQNDMHFWTLGWDDWIKQLGGYPAHFTKADGTKVVVDDAWRTYLRGLVEAYTNTGVWDPAKPTPDDGEAADGQAAWAAMPAAVKNACAQSVSNWYQNFENFQAKDGKRFFLNHYYHSPFTIGESAMAAIRATNDTYTAMSEKEFFANCYAEYFRDPNGAANNSYWGGNLPGSVKNFFKEVVVDRHPYAKFKQKQKQDKAQVKAKT